MKNLNRRQFAFLSGLSLLSLSTLSSCGKNKENESVKEEAKAGEKKESAKASSDKTVTNKKTIKDHGDNVIEIPEKIEKSCNYLNYSTPKCILHVSRGGLKALLVCQRLQWQLPKILIYQIFTLKSSIYAQTFIRVENLT